MTDTKEKILLSALDLFSKKGYDAVSVSMIAGASGLTKGALYRHYRDKRDIFESIIERAKQLDGEISSNHGVPSEDFSENAGEYRDTDMVSVIKFSRAMFDYWTQDPFALRLRRMLTIEQYGNKEINGFYGSCLVSGPVEYLKNIFSENGFEDFEGMALRLYSPMFFLFTLYDSEPELAKKLLNDHLNNFMRENIK